MISHRSRDVEVYLEVGVKPKTDVTVEADRSKLLDRLDIPDH